MSTCRCGHPQGFHFSARGSCMHYTDTRTWACECWEYRRPSFLRRALRAIGDHLASVGADLNRPT